MKDQVRGRSGEVSPPQSHLPLDVGPSHLALSRSAGSAVGPVHQEHSKHHLLAAGKENKTCGVIPLAAARMEYPWESWWTVCSQQRERTARRKWHFQTRLF